MSSSTQKFESEKFFAEQTNGLAAIIGLIAALGSYSITGQIIPGVF